MRAEILRVGEALRASYWFIPALMALSAIVLAGGMIYADTHVGSRWMDGLRWLYAARPDGARQVLSAIGGSMITVAGTVFSVTIASVVFASGQYGPRLLTNFMGDRGNQVTLGTFIATFVYCLLVLRTIRSADEAGGTGFVPNLALLVAVALALSSIAVLIFFIHHVPSRLHINSVIHGIGTRLLHEIDGRFPKVAGSLSDKRSKPDALWETAALLVSGSASTLPISARATGYIQVIDESVLTACAVQADVVIRLHYQPGDFIHAGRPLGVIEPAPRDDAITDRIVAAFGVGAHRTALQDLRFLIDELVEIAARALSPGVNDPFTAVTCMDWLGAALSELAGRDLPSPARLDDEGRPRLIARPIAFDGLLERSFGALVQYSARDTVAALGFVRTLGEIALACDRADHLKAIDAQAMALETLARSSLHGVNLERVVARSADLRLALKRPAPGRPS